MIKAPHRRRAVRSAGSKVLLLLTAASMALFGAAGSAFAQGGASSVSAAQSSGGSTISPLQYNCGQDSSTCGPANPSAGYKSAPGVGETYGSYNGSPVRLLYTENFYCGTPASSYAAKSSTGCEAGYSSTTSPPANTTNGNTLYIPVPLFKNPPPTQCHSGATCIDHPTSIDLSPLASLIDPVLGTTPSQLDNTMIPGHDHVVGTLNANKPEWWKVEVVATTNASVFNTLTSVSAINAAVANKTADEAPTNVFLFFQVLPGTVPVSQYDAAMSAGFPAYSPPPSYTAGGKTFTNLKQPCGAGGPNCSGVGVTSDWINGGTVQALYTQNFFCGSTANGYKPKSSSGCEAGSYAGSLPPGVTGPVPNATTTNSNVDPLYIPVPLFKNPTFEQCPAVSACIDHPTSIDLSQLSSVLDPVLGTTPSQLANTMLPGHDHLLTTVNTNNPEWWNVVVIPVTTQAALNQVQSSKSYSAVKAMETSNFSSGVGPEIGTNAYLWFQVLPGAAPTTPGPLQSDCMRTLPSGSVVGMAQAPSGNGYWEVDSKGDVAAMGGAPCYGALTGIALNKPIVGIATDQSTGGYWLVASDGGVFSFNAPFMGSMGNVRLNKPVVGMAPTLNGNGYWLVASDGGVFSFGSAAFHGSMGDVRLNKPVVGMSADRATGGYWLVASDGGVFSFDAPFMGSMGGVRLNKPVVGMASVASGLGYRLFASDGGVFAFNASYLGSMGDVTLNKPVVGGVDNTSNDGYWMVASDGGIFSFGTPFYGSAV